MRPAARAWPFLLPLLLAACGGGPHYEGSHWDGRRGYDGDGDYGYSVAAARSEARGYRTRASRAYPRPGPPEDPWRPYVREAADRFGIPERWIREVMRQESGGRLRASDGSLTTSYVGAMGLMQVMPATYDILRRRYALRDDPYEPHDNVMAGAAYIREMYDRFGAPGFLAAYNAGPDRLAAYNAGVTELPDETVNYVARIAPRLGDDVAMTGPLAAYAAGAGSRTYAALGPAPRPIVGGYGGGMAGADAVRPAPSDGAAPAADPADRAYAGGGMAGIAYYSPARDDVAQATVAQAPAMAVATAAPTATADPAPVATPPPLPMPQYAARVPYASPSRRSLGFGIVPRAEAAEPLSPVPPPGTGGAGQWGIQVGAFPDAGRSREAVRTASADLAGATGARATVVPVARNGGTLYRARLMGLSATGALSACAGLQRHGMACFTVPPGA